MSEIKSTNSKNHHVEHREHEENEDEDFQKNYECQGENDGNADSFNEIDKAVVFKIQKTRN